MVAEASKTMKNIARPLVLAVLTLLLATPLPAQDWKGSGRIQGKVVDPAGEPCAGATVTLRRDSGDPASGPPPLVTDKKGRWSYLGLAGGQWTVTIETEEYLVSEGTVTIRERGGPGKPLEVQLAAPAPGAAQKVAADLVERGNALLQAGDSAAARAAYEEAMTLDAGSKPALLRGIAQTWIQEGETRRALALLEQSLTLAPDDAVALKLVISVLLAEGRDEAAEPYIARLPEGEKLDTASRLNMGIELYNQGDLDGALGHFEQAIADFPDDPEGYYYRGLTYLGQERNEQAAADLKKVLELDPDSPKAEEARQFLEYLGGQ